ncbi:hypothetical protein D9736_22575 [Escherichia sp. E10V10]|nr:hypothetical protein D9736_22575 [Escherichia sp. E10V10]
MTLTKSRSILKRCDLIFHPKDNSKCTPEGLIEAVLNWRISQSLPIFKDI